MKKLLRKKSDPPQQPNPPPTPTWGPPPHLFARLASSQSAGSSTFPPVTTDLVHFTPRESAHDGSPPKMIRPRATTSLVQRSWMPFEEQWPANGGKGDNPLLRPKQTLSQRMNQRAFYREPAQLSESSTPSTNSNDLSSKPTKSIPESRNRMGLLKSVGFLPATLDTFSTLAKSQDTTKKLVHTPISSLLERRHSTMPVPVPEPMPSLLLENPPDRLQPRRKYFSLETFGLASGESFPAPSTTINSMDLPSQNAVSTSSSLFI